MNPYLTELIQRYPRLEGCTVQIQTVFDNLCACYERDGIVYICGNGGSAADAEHIVGELMKSFSMRRDISKEIERQLDDSFLSKNLQGALRAVALTGTGSLATAFANDVNAELVFAQQVFGYGRAHDVLWGISTSGHSKNVLHAMKVARAKDMRTIGLTGHDGGAMMALCDACICVPEFEVHRIQELHLPVYHALCRMLEARFFEACE